MIFWLLNTPFYVVLTGNDDPSGRIEDPSAWKHARTGHFERTLEEVEVHNGLCPLVKHPRVVEIEVRVKIGSGCLLGPALGKESDV